MIEWLIGATLLGGLLFGGGKKKPSISNGAATARRSLLELERSYEINPDSGFSEWRKTWAGLVDATGWIPKGLASEIIRRFPPHRNGSATPLPNAEHPRLEKALRSEFSKHNATFLQTQKEKRQHFFSSVERNPLTDEQMDCCICMDDAVQIVAAAGSGKTSTIVARVGYALTEGLATPDQILILAFNKSVQQELTARIKARLGHLENADRITVRTFNAFGLSVIGQSTGRKPRLAEWVKTGKDIQELSQIVEDLRQQDPRFRTDWDIFRTVFGRDIGDWESTRQPGSDSRKGGIQTADGKLVKSQEERMICDFLFYHGVSYEYERAYEYDTVSEDHSQYHPDFYYPNIELYHEHFALDETGRTPAHFTGDYVAGVRWKRTLHAEKGTPFFETTSHGLRNGNDLDRLKEELERRGEVLEFDENRSPPGQPPIPTAQLVSTIRTFQQHVKSNGLTSQDLHRAIGATDRGHRGRLTRFVELYERVANEWQRRLNSEGCVDYDDMLLGAIHHIEDGSYRSPYTMVLADEFQDVSQAKLRLLKALKVNAVPEANLCVVGDDWQGINRFAGADISVMTGFQKTFPHSTQLTLSKTFRCPKGLCDASSEFVQKNPRQIKKVVETTNEYNVPPLHAFASETLEASMDIVERHLKQLHGSVYAGDRGMPQCRRVSVMLLGRYHKDRPVSLATWQHQLGDFLDIRFTTAHAAKGLEADYVMLLNLTEGLMGFPSQIVDDPVLQLAMPEPDGFPFAEERRLFYVALTRARRQTRIYTLKDKPSRFVVELSKDGLVEIKSEDATLKVCPKCGDGILQRKTGPYSLFDACSRYPECDYTKRILTSEPKEHAAHRRVRLQEPISEGAICPTCGRGKMVVRKDRNDQEFLACSAFPKCKTTAAFREGEKKSVGNGGNI
ncbi:UvrD-helicase domain-containing protein [Paenirhodobacter hankyongi]|uniref:DNA 3'-5' helicase n=1 Tax=Paenirhodobacter hankyongi TaxID=2294033 RepID=A0A421BKE8_9RHOB|nr:UvrD-helicase domain-containing protein [Sinirhodobacter hankyongi]RLL62891.1 helicase IV [Sinirhodobacter hankyongi]